MKPFRFILTACAFTALTQVFGQAPKPSVAPQSVKPKQASIPALKPFPRKTQKLNFVDGDQILLVGDGLIEQAQKLGYMEYRITVQNSGKKLHFHNIGWSGDTPAGIARDGLGTRQAGHEPVNEGWLQLRKQITDIKPTVAIIGYGMASSLDAGTLEQFRSDYQRLVEQIKASAGKENHLRLVL